MEGLRDKVRRGWSSFLYTLVELAAEDMGLDPTRDPSLRSPCVLGSIPEHRKRSQYRGRYEFNSGYFFETPVGHPGENVVLCAFSVCVPSSLCVFSDVNF